MSAQPHQSLIEWANEALRVDIPLDVLAEALPYDGATEVEAEALIDALVDAGWLIVPSPRYGR